MALRRWRYDTRQRLDGYRAVDGNAVALLVDGAAAFPAMLEAIASAKKSIVLESYIYADDTTGQRFLDALVERARQGVDVHLLIDGVGSIYTDVDFFAPLREAGGHVGVYRPPAPWRPWWRWWRRDHRKVLVVDDQLGFIGGLNIADDYAPTDWGGDAWHDMHARVEGPAAHELTKLVHRTWLREFDEVWHLPQVPPVEAGTVPVQVVESRLTRRYSVRRAYITAIRRARRSIHISNAYFVPDQGVRRALRNAARQGVQVRLLLAGRTDLRSVQYASRALYTPLMRWGVELYEWNDKVLHAKCAVIDGRWCSIGSYNMDRRSLLHNLEANIVCIDEKLGATMEAQFARDIEVSERIDEETWHRRQPLDKLFEQLFFKLRIFL